MGGGREEGTGRKDCEELSAENLSRETRTWGNRIEEKEQPLGESYEKCKGRGGEAVGGIPKNKKTWRKGRPKKTGRRLPLGKNRPWSLKEIPGKRIRQQGGRKKGGLVGNSAEISPCRSKKGIIGNVLPLDQ